MGDYCKLVVETDGKITQCLGEWKENDDIWVAFCDTLVREDTCKARDNFIAFNVDLERLSDFRDNLCDLLKGGYDNSLAWDIVEITSFISTCRTNPSQSKKVFFFVGI